jgi:SAM-dependent methyltransferase
MPDPLSKLPHLYREFADWWPLLSTPEDYVEEADFFFNLFLKTSSTFPQTLLELGSGGGNNASHLKHHFQMTLVDLSSGMIEVSRRLNPECEHIQGDMRAIRLMQEFDLVFIHDAVMYMTTEADLARVIETAYVHCKLGGVTLFVPDHVKESFRPSTKQGGQDGELRSMRYLEWTWDPDPADSTYLCDFVYLLRDETGEVRCEYDRHEFGLFSRNVWKRLFEQVGFTCRSIPFDHSELEPGSCEVFLGLKSRG